MDAAFWPGFARAPRELWQPAGRRPAAPRRAMASTRSIEPPRSNWLLFSAMVEAFLAAAGASGSGAGGDRSARTRSGTERRAYGDGPLPLGLLQQLRDPAFLVDVLEHLGHITRAGPPRGGQKRAALRGRAGGSSGRWRLRPGAVALPLRRLPPARPGRPAARCPKVSRARHGAHGGHPPPIEPRHRDAAGWLRIGLGGLSPASRGLHQHRQPVPVRGGSLPLGLAARKRSGPTRPRTGRRRVDRR